ncbi:MAG: SDR family NAD(P)-dependent oxidoreductase, partial [Bacteroidota bacterium]
MNKTVLITGISSGIGYHLARTYTEKGYQVFGSIRSEADKLRLSKELPDLHLLMFDITDNDAIKRAIKELEAQLQGNGLDILINNAGMVVSGPLMLLEIDEFKRQYDINVFGLLRVTQACLPLLGAVENPNHKPGMIINISSVTGQIAFPFAGAYSSSKFAIEGLSHSLRRELLPFGIRVVIIGPASVKTPIWEKDS